MEAGSGSEGTEAATPQRRQGRRSRPGLVRWLRRVVVGLVCLLVAGSVLVAVAYPSVAAITCPDCYGLRASGDHLYLESGTSAAEEKRVAAVVVAARQRVAAFYGGRTSRPRTLACLTSACYSRIGGGQERGVAVLNRALMLSPRGVDPVIASHELAHVELHARLGEADDEVPQWFDEGLAVVISDDPRWLTGSASDPAADRCTVRAAGPLPTSRQDWLREASKDHALYAKAACRVLQWMDANDGRASVLRLIHDLRSGQRFAEIYRRP